MNNILEDDHTETLRQAITMEEGTAILPEHIREVFSKATCLYPKPEVDAALDRMAVEISGVVAQANPIFLCVVVGGIKVSLGMSVR